MGMFPPGHPGKQEEGRSERPSTVKAAQRGDPSRSGVGSAWWGFSSIPGRDVPSLEPSADSPRSRTGDGGPDPSLVGTGHGAQPLLSASPLPAAAKGCGDPRARCTLSPCTLVTHRGSRATQPLVRVRTQLHQPSPTQPRTGPRGADAEVPKCHPSPSLSPPRAAPARRSGQPSAVRVSFGPGAGWKTCDCVVSNVTGSKQQIPVSVLPRAQTSAPAQPTPQTGNAAPACKPRCERRPGPGGQLQGTRYRLAGEIKNKPSQSNVNVDPTVTWSRPAGSQPSALAPAQPLSKSWFIRPETLQD